MPSLVMPGLDPGIHAPGRAWTYLRIAGSGPGMASFEEDAQAPQPTLSPARLRVHQVVGRDDGEESGSTGASSSRLRRLALPPTAAVLTLTVRSVAKRAR
jgi:hypothetical protein